MMWAKKNVEEEASAVAVRNWLATVLSPEQQSADANAVPQSALPESVKAQPPMVEEQGVPVGSATSAAETQPASPIAPAVSVPDEYAVPNSIQAPSEPDIPPLDPPVPQRPDLTDIKKMEPPVIETQVSLARRHVDASLEPANHKAEAHAVPLPENSGNTAEQSFEFQIANLADRVCSEEYAFIRRELQRNSQELIGHLIREIQSKFNESLNAALRSLDARRPSGRP